MEKKRGAGGKKSILVTILIAVIIVLVIIFGYGVYAGYRLKAEISSLNNQIGQLDTDKADLNLKLDTLQKKYDLLYQDVQNIYKSCMLENACKGRFPRVSWYCNNAGDEVSDPSHICICDSSCNLKATQITA